MFADLQHLDLTTIAQRYGTEETARAYIESIRWPDGAICPHCGCKNAYKVGKNPRSLKHGRPGLWYCRECKDQFTVTEGTVMERSHIPLNKWLMAIYLLGGSKKGISAHQLHRELDLSYKAAFFMAHRIRYAMTQEPIKSKLGGIVEVDETWVGGKERGKGRRGKTRETKKQIVVSLVQRGGEARSYHVKKVTADQLRGLIRKHVPAEGTVFTDSWAGYNAVNEDIETHETVNHAQGEYARGRVNTNTVEGYFSILKRGVYGVYYHVSENHLAKYLAEFDYRYSRRKATDGERAIEAIKMTQGKRLTYRELPPTRYEQPETEGPTWPTTKK